MAASGHGPTIGFGPHLDGSTSDSGQGNRAGLTRPEARVEACGIRRKPDRIPTQAGTAFR
jgi:hypothetical protein